MLAGLDLSSGILGEPEFDGFCLGTGDGLDQAEESFSGFHVSEALFAILGG